jgi:hypothetical protein
VVQFHQILGSDASGLLVAGKIWIFKKLSASYNLIGRSAVEGLSPFKRLVAGSSPAWSILRAGSSVGRAAKTPLAKNYLPFYNLIIGLWCNGSMPGVGIFALSEAGKEVRVQILSGQSIPL